jgi:predicted Zn-dependent protease
MMGEPQITREHTFKGLHDIIVCQNKTVKPLNLKILAMEGYRKLLADEPDSALGNFEIGMLLLDLKKLDDAEKHIREAIRLMPERAQGYNVLALIKQQSGKVTSAFF